MNVQIEQSWKEVLSNEFDKNYFIHLTQFIRQEYSTKTIYPPGRLIFNAFNSCPFQQVKVVIIGQDPYHGPHQANGLCFSVNDGIETPPSLINIYKEIQQEFGTPVPPSGNLQRWANQGVLLLNATLTVEAHKPGSHQNKGWEQFTDAVISALSQQRENIVFILWGSYAQKKRGTYRQKQTPCIDIGTPLTSISLQRILWQQSFPSGQPILGATWYNTN